MTFGGTGVEGSRGMCGMVGLCLALTALVSSCEGDHGECEGEERCACYPNGTCNDGLDCRSSLCVEVDRGADEGSDDDDPGSGTAGTSGEGGAILDDAGAADDVGGRASGGDRSGNDTSGNDASRRDDPGAGGDSGDPPDGGSVSDDTAGDAPGGQDDDVTLGGDPSNEVDDAPKVTDEGSGVTDDVMSVGACVPGARRCGESGSLEICGDEGSGWVVQGCDCVSPDQPECDAPFVCQSGALSCDAEGHNVLQCATSGEQQFEIESCVARDEVCFEGECLPLECVPNTTYCEDNALVNCTSDGMLEVIVACEAPTFCHAGIGGCVVSVCEPGSQRCNSDGTETEICSPDGDAWQPGVACPAGCHNSACVLTTQDCHGSKLYCDRDSLHECDNGFRSTYLGCAEVEYCLEDVDGAGCVPDNCNGGERSCANERFGWCSSTGSGPLPDAIFCPTDQVCDLQFGCADVAEDELGSDDYISSADLLGGYFVRVDNPRRLTEVAFGVAYVQGLGGSELLVFVSDTQEGPYQRISAWPIPVETQTPEYVLRVTQELEAGKFYFIGTYGSLVTYFSRSQLGAPEYLSFGLRITGGGSSFVNAPEQFMLSDISTEAAFMMKFTTQRL